MQRCLLLLGCGVLSKTMARMLFGNEWFEQIAPNALYETEYERIILQQASLLFPYHYAVPFKKTVVSKDRAAKPDLVLIEKRFRGWWVVEVEMADHSLEGHVLPQATTLSKAHYGEAEADYICDKASYLDVRSVHDMVKGRPPNVLVIVNSAARVDWIPSLDRYNIKLAFFEIFRSERSQYVFRVNGFQPSVPSDIVSYCRFDPILPNFLVVDSPAGLEVKEDTTVEIRHNDCMTEWKRVDSADRVWLIPVGSNPLQVRHEFKLVRHEDGTLVIHDEK